MLDLETLGHKPGSVIVAIGAVKFGNGEILDSFYERVDAESCVNLGLRIDASTVLWWMKQNEAARKEITRPGGKLPEVLMRFASWVDDMDAEVWGNGAGFDNVLLSDAYDRAHMQRPWKYTNDRCYRTVKNLRRDVPIASLGTHHNALDDAKSQAMHLMTLRAQAPEQLLADWMLRNSFATGHGDTFEDLLAELQWQVDELRAAVLEDADYDATQDVPYVSSLRAV